MKLFETRKNMNETQNKEKYNVNNAERSNYENEDSKKTLFLDKSFYGWDGDY